jgi:methyl-accepting chemotaxis protein
MKHSKETNKAIRGLQQLISDTNGHANEVLKVSNDIGISSVETDRSAREIAKAMEELTI